MRIQNYILLVLLCSFTLVFGQHPVSKLDKNTHLERLQEGVLLIRLSDQNKKIEELKKRGQTAAAQQIKEKQSIQNEEIAKAFKTHFTFSTIYFIRPQDTKTIIADKNKKLTDVISGESIDLSNIDNIYFTDYGFGHPAEGFERYNRKGFQVLCFEEGQIRNLGRDLFYVGVKQGFFAKSFSKSLQKTVLKLNRRFESGNKY